MRYYKIYFTDEQNRQRVKLLESKKNLSEIQKEFSQAEELFQDEYRIFKNYQSMRKKKIRKDIKC